MTRTTDYYESRRRIRVEHRPVLDTAGSVLPWRAVAACLDAALCAVTGLLVYLFPLVAAGAVLGEGGAGLVERAWLGWLLAWTLVYYAALEARFGRTPGKYLTGLTVVRPDGASCALRAAVVRNLFRPVDFLPAGYLLGAGLAGVDGDGRRLGDMAAGTVVVKAEPADADMSPDLDSASETLPDRAVAAILDWCLVGLCSLLLGGLVLAIAEAVLPGPAPYRGFVLGAGLLFAPAYFGLLEAEYGRTVGKEVIGLVTVKADGSPCEPRDAALRALLLPVDFLPVAYLAGTVAAGLSPRGQRLGDRVAGTVVVYLVDERPPGTSPLARGLDCERSAAAVAADAAGDVDPDQLTASYPEGDARVFAPPLLDYFGPDEQPAYVFENGGRRSLRIVHPDGTVEAPDRGFVPPGNPVLAVTDQRILYVSRNHTGDEPREFDYGDVVDAEVTEKRTLTELRFETADGTSYAFVQGRGDGLAAACEYIDERIGDDESVTPEAAAAE